ncbi:MAG TPA: LysM domain-containing protein [Candidatus Didemnitutus sp.]|nr:LysM domain-containing protein [Candidatus Didemnitutus sp.]
MDTLSRDSSSSSSSIVPMAGLFAAVLALILAIVALVKLSTLQKTVIAHGDEIAKIATIENELHSATAKSDSDMKALRDGVQGALNQVGEQIGQMRAQLTKIEEEAKKKPAPAAAGGKGGPVATGTVDANGNYTVAPQDTISKIARKFGVKVDAIEAENPGLNPAALKVGQKIKIPKK